MKYTTIITLISLIMMQGVSFGAEQKDTSGWPDLFGMYNGKATVTSDLDLVMNTKVQMQIRAGKRDLVILEMLYFEGKIAKFTKCKRIDKYKFQIYETIEKDKKQVVVSGYISSKDGMVFTGKIQYTVIRASGGKTILRTFEFTQLKKVS